MDTHQCKLCFKTFYNGRALGGHMRSHLPNLPIAEKSPPTHLISETLDSVSFSLPSESESESEMEPHHQETNQSYRKLLDSEFSVIVQDRESETESSKNPIRRRSKRRRNSVDPKFNITKFSKSSSASSISDATTEEDVAFCLMMLSRDKWIEQQESEEEEFNDVKLYKIRTTKGKYKCETCKKVFRSYQALGGHRASHKKIRIITTKKGHEFEPHNVDSSERKIHECPVCYRVFASGQALGGHKRSHVSGASAKNATKCRENWIDLNQPAPIDDDDDDADHETSQIEISAVSDAEFVIHKT